MSTRPTLRRQLALIGGISMFAFAALAPAGFAQSAVDQSALARFDMANMASRQVIDYRVIDQALGSLVVADGDKSEIRFEALKGDGERALSELVSGFSSIDPTELNANEQLAYWLNLRAILVLRASAQAYPGRGVDKLIQPGSPFFTTKAVTVSGVPLSIGDIDAIITKRAAANPNVIYGLVLPVREAPSFPSIAYRGNTVVTALDDAARSFINRSGTVRTKADTVQVPRFLINHRHYLGEDDAALIGHIRGLASAKLSQKLATATKLASDERVSFNYFIERSFADRGPGAGSFGGGEGRAAGS
ncbi:MAG: DUF547 domain-containing protein [Sphingomonas sp.]|uniref:DUF547 domain-containing protein n=1 Tax=Sphingomonas sp. TaxID=28214 RepID=UPI00180C5561|nr:hypothetical protein [Zymomonas sp.]MBA4772343.1 DUF547 domain-containing protein [Sphingomonas sp.]